VAVAQDLAQEAFVRLHQHWPRVRRMPSPQAWLSTVGINLARSWWRRHFAQQRAHRRLAARPGPAPAPDPDDVRAVRAAVAALPHRQRAALVLRFYAGLSVTETARQLGCAEGTVKSLTHRAVTALRARLTLDEDEDRPLSASSAEPPLSEPQLSETEEIPHV
jgi:RNA polymerase sigma factor (sigma-70 family)